MLFKYKIQILIWLMQVTNTRAEKTLIQQSSFQFHEVSPLLSFRSHPIQEDSSWPKSRIFLLFCKVRPFIIGQKEHLFLISQFFIPAGSTIYAPALTCKYHKSQMKQITWCPFKSIYFKPFLMFTLFFVGGRVSQNGKCQMNLQVAGQITHPHPSSHSGAPVFLVSPPSLIEAQELKTRPVS